MHSTQIKELADTFEFCPKCGSSPLQKGGGNSVKCHNCGFHYYFNASCAMICVITHHGKLLVVERGTEPAKGTLDLPGGFIDAGETLEEATRREVHEELNLEIDSMRYLFSVTNKYPWSGFYVHTTDMVMEVTVKDILPITAADDVARFFWVEPEDLIPELFGLTSVQTVIKQILNNNK